MALLQDLKNYLDITWEDELGDKKLQGMMERGMAAISGRIGECDFEQETEERALLFDYVMYARAGEIPAFWTNYKYSILSLQMDREVKRFAENKE